MNKTRVKEPNSGRHQFNCLKRTFALVLLGAGLNGQPAEAAAYKIGWLDLSTAGPVNSSVASGSTFHLPGYAGVVTFTYTSPSSLNWIRDTYQLAYDGIITTAGANYGWTYVDYLGAVDYNASPSAIDYTLTFTFSQPVPANQLVLASIGLGGHSDTGKSTATVQATGTFLGDWNTSTANVPAAPTMFSSGSGTFTLENSLADPAPGYFNTQWGVTLITGPPTFSTLTINVHHVYYDGFGFNIGWLEAPCTNNCITLYTPDDITLATCSNSLPVSYSVNFTDTCCSNCVTLVSTPPSGANFPLGTTIVTNTATDTLGNSNTCTFAVTVTQYTNRLVISCPSDIAVTTCSNSLPVSYSVSADSCGCSSCVTLVSTPASGSVFPLGTTIVTNTATDTLGNSNSCTFAVTVTQNTNPPVINCPSNMVVFTCSNSLPVSYAVSASDSCGCSNCVTLVSTPPSGTSFPVGSTIVTNTATDSLGNSNICTFTVTVMQNTNPPVINFSPSTIVIFTNSSGCGPMPDATGQVSATANTGPVHVSQSIPAGTLVCSNTVVTFTIADGCGDVTNRNATVLLQLQPVHLNAGLSNNFLILSWTNPVPAIWEIQRSSNLFNWTTFTGTNTLSPFVINPTGLAQFYRLINTNSP